jgi:hypothetical protein
MEMQQATLQIVTLCCIDIVQDEEKDGSERQELLSLEAAAKEWIRVNHAHEVVEEKEVQAQGSMWSNAFGFGGPVKKEPKKKTREELQKQQLQALEAAVLIINGLLGIPFFQAKPVGLLFELSRCHFLKGNPVDVLQAICSLAAKDATELQVFNPRLGEWLANKVVRLLEELVPATPAAQLAPLADIITGTLKKEGGLSHTLLYALAMATGVQQPPRLQTVLAHEALWLRILKFVPKPGATELARLVTLARDLLAVTAAAIVDATITLRVLHTVLEHDEALFSLLKLLKESALTPKILSERRATITNFDKILQQVKCYVNFFLQLWCQNQCNRSSRQGDGVGFGLCTADAERGE